MKALYLSAFFLLGNLAFASDVSAKLGKSSEPKVLTVTGQAWLTPASGKKRPVKKNDVLREKVVLETEAKAWVIVALTPQEKLIIAPESKVSLPVISWEDGAVERIELAKGQMRLLNMTSQARQVVTELTRDGYAEGDLIFAVEPQVPSVRLSVLEGRALFRGLENEEFLSLAQGEEAVFIGERENGEIAMDVLLAGRRVVRGRMSQKSSVSEATKSYWAQALGDAIKQDKKAKIQAQKEAVKRGAICKSPSGRFNECAWVCENNPKKEKTKCRVDLPNVQCVRQRCDAEGKWSDRLVIPASQSSCAVQPIVGSCNY